jgi:hypothetical protein
LRADTGYRVANRDYGSRSLIAGIVLIGEDQGIISEIDGVDREITASGEIHNYALGKGIGVGYEGGAGAYWHSKGLG